MSDPEANEARQQYLKDLLQAIIRKPPEASAAKPAKETTAEAMPEHTAQRRGLLARIQWAGAGPLEPKACSAVVVENQTSNAVYVASAAVWWWSNNRQEGQRILLKPHEERNVLQPGEQKTFDFAPE